MSRYYLACLHFCIFVFFVDFFGYFSLYVSFCGFLRFHSCGFNYCLLLLVLFFASHLPLVLLVFVDCSFLASNLPSVLSNFVGCSFLASNLPLVLSNFVGCSLPLLDCIVIVVVGLECLVVVESGCFQGSNPFLVRWGIGLNCFL